ncbi:MAG TPA: alkaline phosphatase family protein [Vicinamibacterales bacterium]|nr:alkaline phosphatase family protein [Vicinamibacterales bacterium]
MTASTLRHAVLTFALALPAALVLLAVSLAAQDRDRPMRVPQDPGVITTRQAITPAGVQSVFEGRVYGVAFGASPNRLWVLTASDVYELDWATNTVRQRVDTGLNAGLQGLRFDRAAARALVAGASRARAAGKPPEVRLEAAAASLDRVPAVSDGAAAPAPPVAPATAPAPGATAPITPVTPMGRVELASPLSLELVAGGLGSHIAGALAVAPRPRADGRRVALVPLVASNQVSVVDVGSGAVLGAVKTDIAPFAAVVNDDGTTAWVSCWGGRVPLEGELAATTGENAGADRVVVDARGVAASGTVARIDLDAMRVTGTLEVGLHPTALAWDEARARLYVALGNDDAVAVVDTEQRVLAGRIEVRPFGRDVRGIAPTALALSADGGRLYAACGGINAIAVIETAGRSLAGLIPTAWYPDSLALSPDGAMLAVGALLGAGSGWRRPATPSFSLGLPDTSRRYVHAHRGSVGVMPVPAGRDLVNYTLAVAENNRLPLVAPGAAGLLGAGQRGAWATASQPAWHKPEPAAVPLAPGDPSLVDHVVYIIKENRTYDQLFGDLPQGNGEPSFVLFGEGVAPNHRRLARQFVLLDNFYATGGNSGDGHQWVTQANEADYAMWPGYTGRSYPFDGTDALAYAPGGFIWDGARSRGKSVRIYGEFMPAERGVASKERAALLREWERGADFSGRWKPTPRVQGMAEFVAPDFPAYTTAIPDGIRANLFLRDLRGWEASGTMPNLVLLQLPSNHTYGTSPGLSTPQAMVADNDLALGRVVEALTRSRFWPRMAIFVVEDDAQDGVDHVDGHRTVALAVSPYVRRRQVDSTFYSHPSILKTIELMLGLPPLSIFDRIANDMRASFTDEPDLTPYTAVVPKQSLHEVNPPAGALKGAARAAALASARMRFDVPDAAPTDRLNRTLWHAVKGWDVPYPGVRRAVFAPLSIDVDDDEREDAKAAGRGRR